MELASMLQSSALPSFESVENIFPSPHASLSRIISSNIKPFPMESVLLPPEQMDLTSPVSEVDQAITAGGDFPQFIISLFDNEVITITSSLPLLITLLE
jgi:hypothetical protein